MARIEDILRIRDFCRSDLSNVLEILRLSFVEEFEQEGFDPEHIETLVSKMFGIAGRALRGLLKILGKEFFKFLVAEVRGRVVGTTMITRHRKTAYISAVAVHPDFRREGIARSLLENALRYVQDQRMKRAILHVMPTNSSAKKLYKGFGFEDFEKLALFVADAEQISSSKQVDGIEIADFHENQTDTVFELLRCSENPERFSLLDYAKKDLNSTFFEKVFRLYGKVQMVALRESRIVGYIEATYTTRQEAGQISNIQVRPELREKGIEEMLISAVAKKVRDAGTKKIIGTVSVQRTELIAAMIMLGFKKHLDLDGLVFESS